MKELCECPFCEGKGRVAKSCYNGKYFACCDIDDEHNVGHFSGGGAYDTKEEAIAAWNTRRTPNSTGKE